MQRIRQFLFRRRMRTGQLAVGDVIPLADGARGIVVRATPLIVQVQRPTRSLA